ncbi:MAG: hypothetical protein NZ891_01950 [bacterium]|nr:hypothetical protein [bacterium]MDW8163492.1 hypothetical protein [Candidatus Omnitrophota bacterium]
MNFDLDNWKNQIIEFVNQKIRSNQIKITDFKEIIEKYRELSLETQKLLEYVYKNAPEEEKKEFYKLYQKFLYQNAGEMVEELRRLGNDFKKNKSYENIIKSLNDQSFRIMERTRYVQRSEVQYMIMRIFVVNKKEFPELLSNVFNPVYSDELFKTFIYSFLSAILTEKEQGGGE